MPENPKPPVAIRIVRPYESEEAFLEHELETVGKTSVILIGAHARPQGVILRFEVVLASGMTLLRGEGRVLSHKESAFKGQPGLSLRFTRLDPRSKALVDRAVMMREARASGVPYVPPPAASEPQIVSVPEPSPVRPASVRPANPLAQALSEDTPSPPPARTRSRQPPPLPSTISNRPPPPPEPAPSSERATEPPERDEKDEKEKLVHEHVRLGLTPPPAPVMRAVEDEPTHVETRSDPPPPPLATLLAPPGAMTAPPPDLRESAEPNDARTSYPSARTVERPGDRDALLDRLRARRRDMDDERVKAVERGRSA